jgi:hypothetical protein
MTTTITTAVLATLALAAATAATDVSADLRGRARAIVTKGGYQTTLPAGTSAPESVSSSPGPTRPRGPSAPHIGGPGGSPHPGRRAVASAGGDRRRRRRARAVAGDRGTPRGQGRPFRRRPGGRREGTVRAARAAAGTAHGRRGPRAAGPLRRGHPPAAAAPLRRAAAASRNGTRAGPHRARGAGAHAARSAGRGTRSACWWERPRTVHFGGRDASREDYDACLAHLPAASWTRSSGHLERREPVQPPSARLARRHLGPCPSRRGWWWASSRRNRPTSSPRTPTRTAARRSAIAPWSSCSARSGCLSW